MSLSIKEIATEIFGENSYSIVAETMLGIPEQVWMLVNNSSYSQVFFRDEQINDAIRYLNSALSWLQAKEIYVFFSNCSVEG